MRSLFIKALIIVVVLLGLPFSAYAVQPGDPDLPPGISPEEQQKSPDPHNYPYFVREIPVAVIDANKVGVGEEGYVSILLKDDLWLWGEQWTGPSFSRPGMEINENVRWGLNDTFVRVNPDMTPAKASGPTFVTVVVPDEVAFESLMDPVMYKLTKSSPVWDAYGSQKIMSWMLSLTNESGEEKKFDPIKGSQNIARARTESLPSTVDDFLAQKSGISPELLNKYTDVFKLRYQSMNGDELYKVDDVGQYIKGRYHLMIYSSDNSKNWTYPAKKEAFLG